MNNRRLQPELSNVLPMLRGLLADATDDPDRPYRPVIFRVSTSKASVEQAASAPTAKGKRRSGGSKTTGRVPLAKNAKACTGGGEAAVGALQCVCCNKPAPDAPG